MKRFLIVVAILLNQYTYAQLKDLIPAAIDKIALNPEEEKAHYEKQEALKKIEQKIKSGIKYDDLLEEEKAIYNFREDITIPYYAIFGHECTWYCEKGHYEVSASSYLKSEDTTHYKPQNAGDLNYKNVWIEGTSGNGVGEYLSYAFKSTPAERLYIEIINGHVKSDEDYKDYARAKKIKLYIDDVPYAILNLFDRRANQTFPIDSIHKLINQDNKIEGEHSQWTLKFEILEIYKGLKYDNVVISEILFDGAGIH